MPPWPISRSRAYRSANDVRSCASMSMLGTNIRLSARGRQGSDKTSDESRKGSCHARLEWLPRTWDTRIARIQRICADGTQGKAFVPGLASSWFDDQRQHGNAVQPRFGHDE